MPPLPSWRMMVCRANSCPGQGILRRVSIRASVSAVIVAALTAGCGAPVAGNPVAEPAAGPPIGQPVAWQRCDDSDLPREAQCGRLIVPVDYSQPAGATASLALIRFPATGSKIGSLVVNPGGPGESGVGLAADLLDALPRSVRQRFDLVGFDPRGVGASTPAVVCNSDTDNDAIRADPQVDYSPAGVANIEDTEKQFVQRCLDKTGRDMLANVGTVNVARDLDRLRAALGDEKLTYLGYSYGTLIGSAYAEAYPDKVRALILDGVVDPQQDQLQSDIEQAKAFQQAFDDYAADCAKDADCPLGADKAKAVNVFHDLVDPLVSKPARTKDPRGLGYSDAVTGTVSALYSPEDWSYLTDGLGELKDGRGDTLLGLADEYWGRDAKGHYDNSDDAMTAINCVDYPPVTDRTAVVDADRRTREVAPFMSYGQFTGHAPLDTCAFWPVPPTSGPHQVSAPGLPPVLVVSTTDDPATPYQAGVNLAKDLGARLLTFDGTQHTVVFEGEECVDRYAAAYLVDLTLPPEGAKC